MNKRALALSGGGSKGAYSVGVIRALLEEGKSWDIISGVSVGALLASWLAMYPPKRQLETYEGLEEIWYNLKGNKSIYKNWAPGFLTYIWSLWKGSIYNMQPLKDILNENLDEDKIVTSGVDLSVGVTSLTTGRYKVAKGTDSNIKDWVWASAVFPMLFPPVKIEGEKWVDGGIRNTIPVMDVINSGTKHIDVVATSPLDRKVDRRKGFGSIIDVGTRVAEIASNEIYINDLQAYCDKQGIKLNVYAPPAPTNEDAFEFNPEEMKKIIQKGYEETKTGKDKAR